MSSGKHASPRRFFHVFLALGALAALSYAMSFVSLGWASFAVAMIIALAKVVLVVLFFMELIEQGVASRVAIVSATILIAILAGLLAGDVMTRAPPPLRPPPISPAS